MIAEWLSSATDWVVLLLDGLWRNSRILLGFIALILILFATVMVAPLFIPINFSYPIPVCGIYVTRPIYARILGTNNVLLKANSEDLDFSVTEGNYLVTILKETDLESDDNVKKS